MTSIGSQFRPTIARVDLSKVAANFGRLRAAVAPSTFICPMVKANAYGHGDVAIARKLRSLKAQHLGVGLVEEGLHLREAGDTGSILHFGLFDERAIRAMIEHGITPVVSSMEQLEVLLAAVSSIPSRNSDPLIDFHLKFNTGMNRLGVSSNDWGSVIKKVVDHGGAKGSRGGLRLSGVCTHFSDGDDFGSGGRTDEQLLRLSHALTLLASAGLTGYQIHVSNSSAVRAQIEKKLKPLPAVLDSSGHLGLRPGLAVYGAEPGFLPALEFLSRIVLIQDVRQGERVSYGGRWTASRNSKIGIVPCGYADGFRRGLNNQQQARVIVRGRLIPVVGAICMDYFMCDLTEVQGAALNDEVTMIGGADGPSVSVSDLAKDVATIPYEIFTGISERVPRVYVDDGPSVSVI